MSPSLSCSSKRGQIDAGEEEVASCLSFPKYRGGEEEEKQKKVKIKKRHAEKENMDGNMHGEEKEGRVRERRRSMKTTGDGV